MSRLIALCKNAIAIFPLIVNVRTALDDSNFSIWQEKVRLTAFAEVF